MLYLLLLYLLLGLVFTVTVWLFSFIWTNDNNGREEGEINEILSLNGGAGKRHDEHRELIELLETRCPEILDENFWVRGWLKSQDEYLNRLRELALKERVIQPHWEKSISPLRLKSNIAHK